MDGDYCVEHADCRAALARLDERLRNEERLRHAAERAAERALELATKNLTEHLHVLNGETGRIKEEREAYLRREVYETFKETMTKEISTAKETAVREAAAVKESVTKEIGVVGGNLREMQGRMWLIFAAAVAAAGGIGAAVSQLFTGGGP